MKCPNCDQEVESSATFCGNCGHQLHAPAQPEQPVTPATAEPTDGAAPSSSDTAVPAPSAPIAPPVDPGSVPQMPAVPTAGQVPAYAVGQEQGKGAKRLTLAIVLAAFSIPGALIPILGFGLAVTALIIALQHKQADKAKMVTAMVLAGLGVVLSILAYMYFFGEANKNRQTGYRTDGPLTTSVSMADVGVAAYGAL